MNFFNYPPQLQRAFEALGLTILHSLWQGLLLMILLWALLRFIRYEKANLRFILAFGTLMLMLLAFTTTFIYEWDSLRPMATVSQSFSTESITLTELQVSNEPSLWEEMRSEAYSLFYQLAENAHLLAIAWLAGSFLFSLRLSLGLWQIHQLRQERQSLTEFWKTKAFALQQALHIRRSVEVSTNSSLDTPITLGWLQPMILLPASMLTAMPAEQVESILVHELAHIRRHDYLWNLLQSMTEVILFYHPAYWYIASVLEQEREHACDAITLKITGRPQVYAQALLQVASLRTTLSAVGLSARGRSSFAERIRRIVAPQQKKKGVQPLPFLLSFCLIGFLLFAFTLKSPFEEQASLVEEKEGTLNFDSLRAPDYVRHSSRMDLDISLYKDLIKSSSNQNDYIIGKASSSAEDINPRTYFKEETLYLLDGKVVDDPESIMMSEIEKVEVYHEPLPASLQNLSSRNYATVVRVLSKIPAAEAERSTIPISGFVRTGKDGKVIPVPNIPVQVKSTGEQTVTDQNGRFTFSSVGKEDSLLFDLPAHRSLMVVPVDNREHISIYTHIPKRVEDKTIDKLKQRMSPEKLNQDRRAIDNRIGFMDSSFYEVLEEKILINLRKNTQKLKSDATASGDDSNPFALIRDPELHFTLDGVVTDPRSVSRKLVESTSFEMRNTANGYVLEVSAISKEAAEAARTKPQKITVRGTVKDKETSEPLSGAFIFVKGTNIGSISDLYGNYQIEVPEANKEIVFTFSGYETRTEAIQNSKILEIAMSPELENEVLSDKIIVRGRVVDATSGSPLANVEVFSKEKGERIEGINTFTDQNGEYQFAVPADFKVMVHSKEGYPDHVIPIHYLTGDKAKTWEIVMKKQPQVNKKEKIQSPLIQGQVIDAKTGQGIPGANVLISGTTIGTVTNGDGRYLLKLTDDAQSLSFNAIGYQKQQIPIDGNVELNAIILPLEIYQIPDDQDSILFIIDDVVREDIKSFKELDEKYPLKGPHSFSSRAINSVDRSLIPSMSASQLKQYKRLVTINTYSAGPKQIARGKIIDAETKRPLAGVEVTSLTERGLKTYTDENGEYELKVTEHTEYLHHALPGYLPFVFPSNMATAFDTPIHMTLKRFDEDGFENSFKVFPNPGNDEIKVSFSIPEAASVEFELLDNEGTFLTSFEYHFLSSGEQEITIPVSKFPPDTYLLRINLNGESIVKRVILK